jgi:hypothetical protein
MMGYAYLHEAVAAAVRRKFPQLTVTSDMPAGEVDGWPFVQPPVSAATS